MNPDLRLGNEDLLNLCEGEIKPTWVTARTPLTQLRSALVAQRGGSDITPRVSWPFQGHQSNPCDDIEFTLQKHEAWTSKQLLRGAPTPIKLDPWRCLPIRRRDVLELKHNTAWSALNGSWMQELADEQSLPCP